MKILRHKQRWAFIKEEREDMRLKKPFRVKHEDTETQTTMALLKRKREDMKIEESIQSQT